MYILLFFVLLEVWGIKYNIQLQFVKFLKKINKTFYCTKIYSSDSETFALSECPDIKCASNKSLDKISHQIKNNNPVFRQAFGQQLYANKSYGALSVSSS